MKNGKQVAAVVIGILVLDQILKIWVKTHMTIGEEFGWGMFWIHFVENPGMAFGQTFGGEWGKYALSIFRIVAIGFLIHICRQLIAREAPGGLLLCFALILAGAIGNIIDSAFYGLIFSTSTPGQVAEFVPFGEGYAGFLQGRVVDMFHLRIFEGTLPDWLPVWGGEYWEFFRYIFNVADAGISLGVVGFVVFYRAYLKE